MPSFILILVLAGNPVIGSASVTSVQFDNQPACKSAGDAAVKAIETKLRMDATFVCVPSRI